MAKGSGTSFRNPFDEENKKKKTTSTSGPTEGSTRNHPTRKGVKQKFTGGVWRTIRGDGSATSGSNQSKLTTKQKMRQSSTKNRQSIKRSKAQEELARLKGGGKHRPWWKVRSKGPETEFHKGRIRQLENQLGKDKNQTTEDTNKTTETKKKDEGGGNKPKVDSNPQGNVRGHIGTDGKFIVHGRGEIRSNVGKKGEGDNKVKEGDKKTAESDKTIETKPKKPLRTTIHTRHYETGEPLGVMTRAERTAYEKEAGQRTFESEVARHHKDKKTPKHLKKTKYKASIRKETAAQRLARRQREREKNQGRG